jgi:hypothetical protein
MSNREIMVGALTAALLAFAPSLVLGQCTVAGTPSSCGLPGSATMTAGRVIRLQMTATSTTLTAPTAADFDAGFNSTTGPTLTVSANSSWSLYVRSATPLWSATTTSPSAPARTDKPVGDLRWSTNSGGPFVALTTGDTNLLAGVATAADTRTLYFQTAYSWLLDTPGDYGLTLILSLTAP